MINSSREDDQVSTHNLYSNPVIAICIPNVEITFPSQNEPYFLVCVQMLRCKLFDLFKQNELILSVLQYHAICIYKHKRMLFYHDIKVGQRLRRNFDLICICISSTFSNFVQSSILIVSICVQLIRDKLIFSKLSS